MFGIVYKSVFEQGILLVSLLLTFMDKYLASNDESFTQLLKPFINKFLGPFMCQRRALYMSLHQGILKLVFSF